MFHLGAKLQINVWAINKKIIKVKGFKRISENY